MALSTISSAQNSVPATGTSAKNAALTSLADKFPNLNLGAGSKIGPAQLSQSKGKYNVTIDPVALRKMGTDGSIKSNLEETLGNIEQTHDEVERLVTADGQTKLVGVYSFVDKDGKDAGGIVVVDSPPREGATSKSRERMEKLREELKEKRKMELEEQERLDKKKAEKKKQAEKSDSVELSESATVDIKAETAQPQTSTPQSAPVQTPVQNGQIETPTPGTGGKVDFSV